MKIYKKLSFVLIAIMISICLISAISASDVNDTNIGASDDISHTDEINEILQEETSNQDSSLNITQLKEDNSKTIEEEINGEPILGQSEEDNSDPSEERIYDEPILGLSDDEIESNNDLTVLKASDSADILTKDWDPTFEFLQYYIKTRREPGGATPIIEITQDYYATENTTYEGIVIDKPIIINGNGHTIDAKYLSRVFTIIEGEVEIYNLTLIHGRDIKSKNEGATICWKGIEGVLANCTIKDSYLGDEMTKYGGGLYAYGSHITIDSCTFENLHANYGNAIYCYDNTYHAAVEITNSKFKNNLDPAGHYYTCYKGGAIYLDADNTRIYLIDNCWFENNMAENGGAVYAYKSYSGVCNCVFYNNTASKSGGAIYYDGKQKAYRLHNNLFTSNKIASSPEKFTKYDNIYSTHAINAVKNWWGNTKNNINEDLTFVNENVYAKSWYYFDTSMPTVNVFYVDEMTVALRHTNATESKNYENPYLKYNLLSIGGQKFTTQTVNFSMSSSFSVRYGVNTVSYTILPADEAKYTIYLGKIEIFTETFQPQKTYSLKELQYIVSNTQDKLTLDHDYTYNERVDNTLGANIIVDHELTIDGNGHTVDGLGHVLFEITSDNVVIENINLVNATYAYGSAIFWKEANNGILRNSTINNGYSFTGGVVYIKGNNISLISNTFDSDTVVNAKGIVYLDGSDIKMVNNTFTRFTVGSNAYPICTSSGSTMNKILAMCSVYENNYAYASFSELQSSVNKKASTLTLKYDYYYYDSTDSALINGINMTRSKIIEGNGFTINGAKLARVFNIGEGLTVTFNNIHFIDAQNLINSQSSTLIFNNCTFDGINNTLNFENVTCQMTNCSFDSNYGEYVIYSSTFNNLSIAQSAFVNNNVTHVIDVSAEMFNEEFLNITHSVFVNPKAEYEIYSVDSVNYNINNNWWGNTINNYDENNRTSFEADNWYFIDMSASSVYAKVDINHLYTKTSNKTTKENADLPEIEFDLSATNINLNSDTLTLETDGTGITTYLATKKPATLTLVLGEGLITKTITGNGQFNLLQETIYNATAGSTLTLNRSYTFETDKDVIGYIIIDKPLTIDVNGYTINGNGQTGIFYVTADNVVITNMNMINGYENNESDNSGSPILWQGNSGSIINSNFTNNKASEGGVITWQGNEGTVRNCTFINNTADYGGAIKWKGENGFIRDNTFKNNTANYGGAIYFKEDLVLFSTGLDTWVLNSTFENNNAKVYGGAIYASADYVVIYDSEFIKNTADKGGAVYLNGDSSDISISYFENNNALTDGGAVYVNDEECAISDSTFVQNHADQNGGAVTWNDDYGTIKSSTFTNNTAVNGGALYVYEKYFVSKFVDNSVLNSIFENNTATNEGGAIYWGNNENTLNNTKFIKNTAVNGGALYVAGENSVIVKSVFLNNTATSQASAIYVKDESTNISGNIFMDNDGNIIYFKDDSWFISETLNIDYNWFGNNETDYNVKPTLSEDITCNIWYFFNMTMENGNLTITLNNIYNYSNGETGVDEDFKLPDLTVKLDSDNFEVADEATLENGVANLNYVARNTTAYLTASYETAKMTRTGEYKYSNVTTSLADGEEFDFGGVVIEYEVTNPTEVEITITDSEGNIAYSQVVSENIIKPDLAAGNYTIVILNKGNGTVISSNATRNFTVLKLTPTVNINVYNATFLDDVIVEVTTDGNGEYYVTVGDETVTMNLTSGIAQNFTFNLQAGQYNVTVGSPESQNYTEIIIDTYKAEVIKFTPTISVKSGDVAYLNDVIVSVKSDVNGTYTLKFGEITQTINLTENIPQNITFTRPDVGDYLINVTYSETENYNSAKNDSVTVKVFKKVAPISAAAKVNKTKVQITVTVDENMTGFVSMDLHDSPIYIPITNGTATLALTLNPGTYEVNINYPTNDEYYENSTTLLFTVPKEIKENTEISLDVKTDENSVVFTVNVNENTTGLIKFDVRGEEEYVVYVDVENGQAVLEDILETGDYTVIVTYMGDDRFNTNNTYEDFTITGHIKKDTPIEADYSIVNNHVTITVNVDENATGFVKIQIEDTVANIELKDGSGKITTALPAGSYNLEITYLGDENYNTNSTRLDFTVTESSKQNTTLKLDIEVDENNVYFDVQVNENATGIVKFTVISKEKNESSTAYLDVENGSVIMAVSDAEPGNYTVLVTYMGDSAYNTNTTSQDFEVIGHIMKDTEIYAGSEINADKVTLTVKVNENATGFVEVKYGDTIFNIALENGEGTYTTTLPYGSYSLDITYLGDENYNRNSTKTEFTIAQPEKANTQISMDLETNENNVTITVNVNENASGLVKFQVTGEEEYVVYSDVVNGKAVLEDVLETGSYTVVATYMGDDSFNTNITYKDFTVTGHVKIDTPITANVKTNGNRVTLTVTVDEKATGFVKLNIDGTVANIELADGVATLTTTLPANSYFAEITYLGDENYNTNATKLAFTVIDAAKDNTPISLDIETDENNVTFTVKVNSDASGTVKFHITGPEEYTLYMDVINGEAVLEDVLKVGSYSLTVTYLGDSIYNANITSQNFEIIGHVMKDTPITANVETSANKVTVTVNVDENATGFVEVKYDDSVVNIALENGEGTYTTTLPYGSYNLDITYLGDENYNKNSTKTEFTLVEPTKENTPISLDIQIDENNAVITATVNTDATGIVKFQVTGQEEYSLYVDVINGQATLEDILETGSYTVVATYMGDDRYNTNITFKDFTVTGHVKIDTPITAEADVNGNKVTLTVTVDEKATGFVKLNIDGTVANIELVNGIATLTSTLPANSYFAEITYLGDENYNTNATKLTFTVVDAAKQNTPISLDIQTDENNATFTVKVNTDASGTVKFHITGAEEYTLYVDVINGKAVLEDVLKAGKYTITATYMGDTSYNTNTTSKDFEITGHVMKDTPITANVETSANKVTITVNVDENATGFVAVKYDDTIFNIALENGEGTYTTTLPYGSYNLDITYLGDENYNKNSTKTEFTLVEPTKENTPISLDIQIDENNATITVSVSESATGIVKFQVTGQEEYVVYSDVVNGKAVLEDVLETGSYTVIATYMGDDSFNTNITYKDFTVTGHVKIDTPITAEVKTNGNRVTLTVTVDEKATGFVKLNIDGTIANIELVNGVATLTTTLPANSYFVEITYLGDENYNTNATKLAFTIIDAAKQNTPISLDVVTDENNATFTVKVNTDASGTVKFHITGAEEYTLYVDVVNGEAVLEDVLKAGKYTITATYMGDTSYNTNTTSKDFEITGHVMKDTPIIANVETSANKVTITVNVDENATGFVAVKYDDTIFNIALENGKGTYTTTLPYGSYNLDITYLGDENYNKNSTKTEFTLVEPTKENTTISLDIQIDENNATITVSVSESATGLVKFQVTGQEEYVVYSDVINGKAVLEDVLETGSYTVVATYMGDNRFNTNITYKDFTVTGHVKIDTPITAEVKTNGNRVTLTVTVDEKATGFVKLNIDGTVANIELVNGVATLTTTLPANSYFVEITYLGDENYNTNATKLAFTIVDAAKQNTPISLDIQTDENNATFTVKVNTDASGTVKFQITGAEEYTLYVDVINGKAVLEDVLKAGKYTITATYMGDSVYNTNTTSKDFEITGHVMKNTPITANVETSANKVTITVNVDENATGFVAVKYDDTIFNIALENGKGTYTTTLPYGSYNLDITYLGDENYNKNSTKREFTLVESAKENTTISIEIESAENNATITVNVNKDATGIVKFQLTGQEEYTLYTDVVDGKAILEDILESGNYLVTVTYLGDDKYNTNTTSKEFTITGHVKKDTPITAEAKVNGNKVTLTVRVDENATGFVKLNIAGTVANIELIDGVATVTSTLPANSYFAEITYLGDENYNTNTTKLTFTVVDVAKQNTQISLDVVTDENNVTFTVKVNSDASGTVKFQVTGEEEYNLYVDVTNGKAVLEDVLKAGKYTVTATYNGDSLYNSNITSLEFNIENKPATNVTVDIPTDIKAGDSFTISIPDATGNITVSIDGESAVIPLVNGSATVNVGNVTPGSHLIEINYVGDENHSAVSMAKTFTVNKISTVITLDNVSRRAVDLKAGEAGAYYYAILKDANGNVLANKTCSVALNGETYTVKTNEKGEFGVQINLTKAQTYTYAVAFLGDDAYDGSFAASKLTVTKKKTKITAKSKKFKATTKVKKIKVKLKTVKNQYDKTRYLAKGKKLTLTVNGKKYTAKINKKGVAKFKIKKLTKKGKFKAKIRFKGDSTYKASKKTIKITIK